MQEQIKDIQNSMWMLYKEYLHDNDYAKYFEGVNNLVNKYKDYGNEELYRYAFDIGLAWVHLIGTEIG